MLRRVMRPSPSPADYEKAIRAKDAAIRALVEENNRLRGMIMQMTRPATDPRLLRLSDERRN